MMLRSCCGFDAMGAPFTDHRCPPASSAPTGTGGTDAAGRCEECGAARLPDGTAELFVERLKLLGRFGLVSQNQLLFNAVRGHG